MSKLSAIEYCRLSKAERFVLYRISQIKRQLNNLFKILDSKQYVESELVDDLEFELSQLESWFNK